VLVPSLFCLQLGHVLFQKFQSFLSSLLHSENQLISVLIMWYKISEHHQQAWKQHLEVGNFVFMTMSETHLHSGLKWSAISKSMLNHILSFPTILTSIYY
jgi:hypothetical protein